MDRDRPPGWPATLERLASMPGFLADALQRAGGSRFAQRPPDGGFSLVEHACHLRDLEREGYLLRVERLLAEEDPALEDFEGDRIAAERDYRAQDAAVAAGEFAAARARLMRIVGGVAPADLGRAGRFAGKRVTLAEMVVRAAGHDEEHRADIGRLLAGLG